MLMNVGQYTSQDGLVTHFNYFSDDLTGFQVVAQLTPEASGVMDTVLSATLEPVIHQADIVPNDCDDTQSVVKRLRDSFSAPFGRMVCLEADVAPITQMLHDYHTQTSEEAGRIDYDNLDTIASYEYDFRMDSSWVAARLAIELKHGHAYAVSDYILKNSDVA